MLLRFINGACLRKVDSGLKMLIEPIYFWLVASQFDKKSNSNQPPLIHFKSFLLLVIGLAQTIFF